MASLYKLFQVAELEDRIRNKNVQRGESRKNMNKRRGNESDEDEDEDDFFDRTKSNEKVNICYHSCYVLSN